MESLWRDTNLPTFPVLEGDAVTDVLIVGGGMAGLLCAHMLQKAGISCIVAEKDRIAGGTTGGTTAKISAQQGLIYHKLARRYGLPAAKSYLEANLQAVDAFRKLCREIPCDFCDTDSFVYSRRGDAPLRQELETLEKLGYGAEFAADLPLPFPTSGAVKFRDQAQFHPLKFLKGLAPRLPVFENTPIRKIAQHLAHTDTGRIRAEHIIVATHFPFWNLHGLYFLKLYQERSYVLSLSGADMPEGIWRDEAPAGFSFRSHKGQLLLGGGSHRTGLPGEAWARLEDLSADRWPQGKITHRWAAQDCMSLDAMPYIGLYSLRTPNIYAATGFSKWGMTGSMLAAQVLTDRILGKDNPYADLLSPSRTMVHRQLKINMAESAKNLLTVSPRRCPHLGCALKWNPQEHSWDCPCHGSRFDAEGRLLDNPATGDLPFRGKE